MQSKQLNIMTQIEKPITIKTSAFVKEGTIVVNKRDAKIIYKIFKKLDSKAYYKNQEDEEKLLEE